MEMVFSCGMIGDKDRIPKVAWPMHKKNFSLEDGSNLGGEALKTATYPIKTTEGNVCIGFSELKE
tara:strand:- start:292 stop:486 length:195 start_codon:yes stop_codon:yes gene_type:complete